jgi:hypothetical protein
MRLPIRDQAMAGNSRSTIAMGLALCLPPLALFGLGSSVDFEIRWRLWAGAGVGGGLAFVLYRHLGVKVLRNLAIILPSALSLICLGLARVDPRLPAAHFVLGVLLAIAAGSFALQAVLNTGAISLRRARNLAKRLSKRTDWPANLSACRTLPEVRELREAIAAEAGPAMVLLSDPRPQVQIAALGALEFRKNWRAGQPEAVLQLAQSAAESETRAAAILALGGVQHRLLIEAMGECLRDSDQLVRRAAVESLLWDCERRWIWVRAAVRDALADPRLSGDGALSISNGQFSAQAVSDLSAWATESGTLGTRATQSLSLHYSQKLAENADPQMIAQLGELVAHPRSSTVLRVELTLLLKRHGFLTDAILAKLVEPTNPSPLRLMAVEAMLEQFPSEGAVEILREVARQPNRELAIAAAVVVQKYLQIDLGLALGEPPPPLHTREAAEVTRRVIEWAKQGAADPEPAPVAEAVGW